MLPIQELSIRTKNNRLFFVHLEKWSQGKYECKLAAINLGPQLPANAVFGPFGNASTAVAAYQALITNISTSLSTLDSTDAIAVVDNPCNAEFITAIEQKQLLGQNIVVQVNGVSV